MNPLQRYLDSDKDDTSGGDDPIVKYGDVEYKTSEVAATMAKKDSLDKDYTEKTQQFAKDKDALEKQFSDVKQLTGFLKQAKDDPEEARRILEEMLPKPSGKSGDKDRGNREMKAHVDRLERKLFDEQIGNAIDKLRRDDTFTENEKEILKYASDNEIVDPRVAFRQWKGENFTKLHDAKVKADAKKKKEEDGDAEPIIKGGQPGKSNKEFVYDDNKSWYENYQVHSKVT